VFASREDAGAERYVRVVAQCALRRGWVVHAGFPCSEATIELRWELRASGAHCHRLALATRQPRTRVHALRTAVAQAWVTLGFLLRTRPGAVLVVLAHPDQLPGTVIAAALYPALSLASVQLVPPDLRFTNARRSLYGVSRGLGQRWVALSADNRARLARALGWDDTRIDVIYNGIEVPDVRPDERAKLRRRLRAELSLPVGAKLLLTVGRLNRQKGHDLIVGSIPVVAAEHPDAFWVWVGEGPEREPLMRALELERAQNRVLMLGFRDDVPRLLAAADLFVFPSRYEGAPFALLEALASELPVVVSDAGPLPEIVRDGAEGRVAPSEDPDALAAITSWALLHTVDMRRMAAAGRDRVRSDFSREAMCDRTLALLRPSKAQAV
jgi:glycosyltransferase involved in cell wall biosynthesis